MEKFFEKLFDVYGKYEIIPEKEKLMEPFKYLNAKCIFIIDSISENGIPLHSTNISKIHPEQQILLDSLLNDPYIKHPLNMNYTKSYSLEKWFDQGVMIIPSIFMQSDKFSQELKNYVKAISEAIISEIIKKSNKKICYILIGKESKKYQQIIDKSYNLVICLSNLNKFNQMNDSSKQIKNLMTTKIFTIINNFFKTNGVKEINWMSIYN